MTRQSGDQNNVTNTQEILNSILPPLEYVQNSQLYRESVLSTPSTKIDVIELQRKLDSNLQVQQARETGICPLREELYAQCFDELIRQITINCSHRGLLLVRVRDELRMSIQAYQTLYESALAYGMRFALKGEQTKKAQSIEEQRLRREIRDLEGDNEELQSVIVNLEKSSLDTENSMRDNHSESVLKLRKELQQLRKDYVKHLYTVNEKE